MFHNREDAANRLVEALKQYQHEDAVILAVPRGGVPIGKIVADALHFPLDIILTKKIGHPVNKEYAIGAVGINDQFFAKTDGMVPRDYVDQEAKKIQANLKERYQRYLGDKTPVDLTNKTAIIVDDGIATGNTLLATVQLVKRKGAAKVIIASPVGPTVPVEKLRSLVDDVICLEIPPDFGAVGQFYEQFNQVSDEEVISMLNDR